MIQIIVPALYILWGCVALGIFVFISTEDIMERLIDFRYDFSHLTLYLLVSVCVCVCVHACVHACVRVLGVRVRVHGVCACVRRV